MKIILAIALLSVSLHAAKAETIVDGNRILVRFNPDDGNGVTCCCPAGHERMTQPAPKPADTAPPAAESYCVFKISEYNDWIKDAMAAKNASKP